MRLLAVDGNSIVNRAFYGIRPLTTKDGQFTNAIYGFLTMLYKIKNEENPDAVAIAFDLKTPTFRHKAYAGYKATRKGMPEELASQMEPLKKLLTLLGYRLVTCEGFEADDILGTLAKACEENGNECVIATGDRDSLQLVSDKTSVHLCSNKQDILYTPEKILETYGVTPKELIEIKAIQGDTSDNIPGVAGIGPKGAGDLIQRYHTVEYIYDHLDELEIKDGVRKKLTASKENAILSRMLGEINCNAPVDTSVENYVVDMKDADECAGFMARLELFSLIEKYGIKADKNTKPEEVEKNLLEVVSDFDENELLKNVKSEKKLYLNFETENKELKSFAVLFDGKVYISTDEELFVKFIADSELEKYTRNIKTLYAYADEKNIDVENIVFDIELAAYLIEPSSKDYSDKNLCASYEIALPVCADEQNEKYEAFACYAELCEKLGDKIKAHGQEKLLSEIEIPLAKVLARMENIGVCVDRRGIESYGEMLSAQIKELETAIYESAGCEFNINSPKQLGVVLFENLGLPCKKKTKSGYSTNAEVLESLRYEHPVVEMVLRYRTLSKLNSTYCEGLLKVIADDGRIHSNFNQTETRTGRISSTEPNLQNIPMRIELGRLIRKAFLPAKGCVFMDADYSQIELRVLAHMSGDEKLIEAYREAQDIHRITASQVFHIPFDEVTDLQRRNAKAVNFGIVYGISSFGLSQDLSISKKEAAEYIERYFETYPKIKTFLDGLVEDAKKNGYVTTMFGRRRPVPELSSSNFMQRSFGERVAMNAPIQGTAADIIKIAMIRVHDRLLEEHLKSRLIITVHDELLIETAEDEIDRVKEILTEGMQHAADLKVALAIDLHTGKNWYEAK